MIDAWPDLPGPIREGILAMVEATAKMPIPINSRVLTVSSNWRRSVLTGPSFTSAIFVALGLSDVVVSSPRQG